MARLLNLGAVARGDATPGSDVDFLVDFEPGRSLLDQVHLIDDLTSPLGTRIEVVAKGRLLQRQPHPRRGHPVATRRVAAELLCRQWSPRYPSLQAALRTDPERALVDAFAVPEAALGAAIPPGVPHVLMLAGPVRLTIEFFVEA